MPSDSIMAIATGLMLFSVFNAVKWAEKMSECEAYWLTNFHELIIRHTPIKKESWRSFFLFQAVCTVMYKKQANKYKENLQSIRIIVIKVRKKGWYTCRFLVGI